jgi:DNA-directed RNA polymerase subunit RPC12/RpoP
MTIQSIVGAAFLILLFLICGLEVLVFVGIFAASIDDRRQIAKLSTLKCPYCSSIIGRRSATLARRDYNARCRHRAVSRREDMWLIVDSVFLDNFWQVQPTFRGSARPFLRISDRVSDGGAA